MLLIYVLAGAVLITAIWAIYTYNCLVHARNKVEEAFSGIDVQLKQRRDVVPNLVEVVSGYAEHEQSLVQDIAEARTHAIAASEPTEISDAENAMASGIRKALALVEGYPDLKASEQFRQLVRELTELEDEVEAARRIYNQNVEFFNSYAQQFPANLVAGRMRESEFPFLRFDRSIENVRELLANGLVA